MAVTRSKGRGSTSNRRQSGARKYATGNQWFTVHDSAIAGKGAFARKFIPRGTRIVEYVGQRIDADEADRRYDDDAMEVHHTFLFALDNGMVIDAAVRGNDARFINHSCDPNCEAVEEDDRIFVESLRDIKRGEELLYDYSYEREGRMTAAWKKLYACRCGAKNCRGTILKRAARK